MLRVRNSELNSQLHNLLAESSYKSHLASIASFINRDINAVDPLGCCDNQMRKHGVMLSEQ